MHETGTLLRVNSDRNLSLFRIDNMFKNRGHLTSHPGHSNAHLWRKRTLFQVVHIVRFRVLCLSIVHADWSDLLNFAHL